MKGLTWDASLGGAAAGLGLSVAADRGGLARWEVREAAWKAGWPYPVQDVYAWATDVGGAPPTALVTWLEGVDRESHIGLVRARGKDKDVWVGLSGVPRAQLGVLPRQLPEGAQLVLPPVPGARYALADPDGLLQEGPLDVGRTITTEITGEWVVQIDDDRGTVALFPVYVGLVPPELGLFAEASRGVGVVDGESRAEALLSEIRGIYGLRSWDRDPLLDAAARSAMSDPELNAMALSRRLGFEPGQLSRWDCRGPSIEACLDEVLWAPRARPALLGDTDLLGLTTRTEGNQVRLIALIGPS
jgi:hypothetical protein